MFQLLSTISLKLVYIYNYMKKYAQQYIENININNFNNFLITAPELYFFQKLPNPTPAPALESEFGNAPMLHSMAVIQNENVLYKTVINKKMCLHCKHIIH